MLQFSTVCTNMCVYINAFVWSVWLSVCVTCNVYPGSQVKATTSLTMYLSPALIPFAGIIGSGQVVRPTATKEEQKQYER